MVVNILKNGNVADINGTVIRKEDFPTVYKIAEGINQRNGNNHKFGQIRRKEGD